MCMTKTILKNVKRQVINCEKYLLFLGLISIMSKGPKPIMITIITIATITKEHSANKITGKYCALTTEGRENTTGF